MLWLDLKVYNLVLDDAILQSVVHLPLHLWLRLDWLDRELIAVPLVLQRSEIPAFFKSLLLAKMVIGSSRGTSIAGFDHRKRQGRELLKSEICGPIESVLTVWRWPLVIFLPLFLRRDTLFVLQYAFSLSLCARNMRSILLPDWSDPSIGYWTLWLPAKTRAQGCCIVIKTMLWKLWRRIPRRLLRKRPGCKTSWVSLVFYNFRELGHLLLLHLAWLLVIIGLKVVLVFCDFLLEVFRRDFVVRIVFIL